MPLTEDQVKYLKEQILKQIETLPEDKREQIKQYILSLNEQQLEEFIAKNNMMQEQAGSEEPPQKASKSQCVFCSIANKQIESLIIYEDKDYLAALEINPLSKGHTLLMPKKHISEVKQLKNKAFTLANRIGKHIIKKLGAENFQITTSDELKHAIINIIPAYKDKPIDKRSPAKKQELQEIAIKIGQIKKKERVIKIKTDKPEPEKSKEKSNLIRLSRRIP